MGLTEDWQLSRVEELLATNILIQPELEAFLVEEATSTSYEAWLEEVIHLISVVCCKRDLADRAGDGCIDQCLRGSHSSVLVWCSSSVLRRCRHSARWYRSHYQ